MFVRRLFDNSEKLDVESNDRYTIAEMLKKFGVSLSLSVLNIECQTDIWKNIPVKYQKYTKLITFEKVNSLYASTTT